MKSQVSAITLLGMIALANAYSLVPPVRKLQDLRAHHRTQPQEVPVPKDYSHSAPAAPVVAAPVVASYEEEEPVEVERAVVYKAPVRNIERQPIRVAYNEEKSHVTRGGYGGSGGSGSTYSVRDRERDEEIEQDYARNAQYHFASAVDDGIMDQSHIRQESRDGLKVTGSYAYSDGYFKRTVNYEADENGYRVVGETVEPISESGPVIDLVNGKAEVHTQIGGVQTQYSVSADELDAQRKRMALIKKTGSSLPASSHEY